MMFTWMVLALLLATGEGPGDPATGADRKLPLSHGCLIPDSLSMSYAWEFPRNPWIDTARLPAAIAPQVLRGFALFTNTSRISPRFTGGTMTCNNCHPNGGQRDRALPLVGVAGAFPEYNKRSGRMFTLEERIIGCFLRSVNATGSRVDRSALRHENELEGAALNPESREVQDVAAYIRWLSPAGLTDTLSLWRGHNQIAAASLLPVNRLDPKRGKELFLEKCSTCHGRDGQGVDIGDKRPGPLWGPDSWNDGAGAARVYTLAGMIRYWMPYLNPGSLTDEEAQHIAAFITSQSRPGFPFKDKDYLKEKIPPDAVYYKQLYARNPLIDK